MPRMIPPPRPHAGVSSYKCRSCGKRLFTYVGKKKSHQFMGKYWCTSLDCNWFNIVQMEKKDGQKKVCAI